MQSCETRERLGSAAAEGGWRRGEGRGRRGASRRPPERPGTRQQPEGADQVFRGRKGRVGSGWLGQDWMAKVVLTLEYVRQE